MVDGRNDKTIKVINLQVESALAINSFIAHN